MITEAHQEHPELSIRQLCQLLQVNRSWYYAKANRPGWREDEILLRDRIEDLILHFPGYGYRRVTKALQRAGWQVNHKRVLRIMREESLLCQLKRRFVVTTVGQADAYYPNLLKPLELTAPDQAWVADITYIRLPSCFVYLATVLDAYSRLCVGWKLSHDIDTQLALDALEMALSMRSPAPGLIHHSDRGVQYASIAYVERLHQVQAVVSMSATGNCYDNAKAESFFKTLKYEEVYLKQYSTFEEAETNLRQFIEDVYNTKRLHSSLNYLPPSEFEALHQEERETSL
jgi:putative transposase